MASNTIMLRDVLFSKLCQCILFYISLVKIHKYMHYCHLNVCSLHKQNFSTCKILHILIWVHIYYESQIIFFKNLLQFRNFKIFLLNYSKSLYCIISCSFIYGCVLSNINSNQNQKKRSYFAICDYMFFRFFFLLYSAK